jgi:hypothetical protein
MSVTWIPARVTNPGRPKRKNVKESKMSIRRKNPRRRNVSVAKPALARKSNARKKIKLVVAKPAARRKRNTRKVMASAAPVLVTLTKKRKANRKPRRKAKRAANRRRRNPSTALAALSPLRGRHAAAAHTVGSKGLRKANGRRRHALAKRKKNPGFDVQKVLIKGAVLIAGAYVAKTITDKVVELCVDTFKISDDSTLGYVQLLGAIGVVALGEYLQSEFGSAEFDLQPATYAIASFMATDGLSRAFPSTPAPAPTGEGAAPMNGTMITAMNGTMNSMHGDEGGSLPHGYSMLGSLFTDAQLPGPAVGPHNVMQGLAYGASGLAYGSAGVPPATLV